MTNQKAIKTIGRTLGTDLGRLLKWASEGTPEDAKVFYHQAFGHAEMAMELLTELECPEDVIAQVIQSWDEDWKPRFERYLF